MSAKRYTVQCSFDGEHQKLVEFEHGEYVDYAHYRTLEIALIGLRTTIESIPKEHRSSLEDWAVRFIDDALQY